MGLDYKQMTMTDGNYDYKKDVLATVSLGGDEYYTLPQHANDIVNCLNFVGG